MYFFFCCFYLSQFPPHHHHYHHHHFLFSFFFIYPLYIPMSVCYEHESVQTKTLNLHSSVHRHASLNTLSPFLLAPRFNTTPLFTILYPRINSSPWYVCIFISFRSLSREYTWVFSLLPKAACNLRSQFSISADFSIRLRGAGVSYSERRWVMVLM